MLNGIKRISQHYLTLFPYVGQPKKKQYQTIPQAPQPSNVEREPTSIYVRQSPSEDPQLWPKVLMSRHLNDFLILHTWLLFLRKCILLIFYLTCACNFIKYFPFVLAQLKVESQIHPFRYNSLQNWLACLANVTQPFGHCVSLFRFSKIRVKCSASQFPLELWRNLFSDIVPVSSPRNALITWMPLWLMRYRWFSHYNRLIESEWQSKSRVRRRSGQYHPRRRQKLTFSKRIRRKVFANLKCIFNFLKRTCCAQLPEGSLISEMRCKSIGGNGRELLAAWWPKWSSTQSAQLHSIDALLQE